MDTIKEQLYRSKEFESVGSLAARLIQGQSMALRGVSGSLLAFVMERVFSERHTHLLLIASDEDRAEKLRDDCALLIGESSVRFFGARPTHEAQVLDMSAVVAQIETLRTLTTSGRYIIVASPQSIVEKVPPPDQFAEAIVELRVKEAHNFQELIERLVESGFERKDFVEAYGDVAVRGGIVDVFPFVGENPIRLEFWGDTVESIREFDVLTQRSIRELQSVSIVPSLAIDEGEAGSSGRPTGAQQPGRNTATLFDYLKPDALVVLDEPALIKQEVDRLVTEGVPGICTFTDIERRVEQFPRLLTVLFGARQGDADSSDPEVDFNSIAQPSLNGSIAHLVDLLQKLSLEGYSIHLTADTKSEIDRLRELVDEIATTPDDGEKRFVRDPDIHVDTLSSLPRSTGGVLPPLPSDVQPTYLSDTVHAGFIYRPAKVAVLTEHEIFGRLKRRGLAKRRRFKGFSQKELQQLRRGDHVVHVDHGIGTFAGLTKITVSGAEQEVMKLLFAENDALYVNLNFIGRVQKYSSQEGHTPKLAKLGAPDWERSKARAKKRIKDIARDLIALYAKRKHERGHAFSIDTHWQKELEASFMYEDTPDQATATLDVKRDMENPSPMDRLICGDVGFGKTEVAVRAAFKSVLDGKQVALLVPTTILAIQHYNTFQERLERYATRIDNITRFRSKKDQEAIVRGLAEGAVDIIIGTHRLLSNDIRFKDLGLLIIDEEHRFGVSAKEKLRKLKATIDTLSLTATPIPRTLHFSLIGARDLSLIGTPPRNRLPILTEIIAGTDGRQTHWRIVREAILRELHRGGQVYFVHDRVQNIEAVAEQVRVHIPEARVRTAHGQMPGHTLEKTMLDFLERKFDVLLATKIIESGLDIPNVNTIVVNRADRFGLAELYQLRGRVGRSNVQAYAYLLVPPLSVLPKPTLRRLQAIEEFTELGSGFNLAMRDLEIRGAGNIFGAEQSGYIMEMGFEMYERIVREAVDELRREEFADLAAQQTGVGSDGSTMPETAVDADIEALIPDFYIEQDAERLDVYRRLYRATTDAALMDIREELHDRFGEYPEEVENLITLVELRLAASRAGFPKIILRGEALIVTLPPESDAKFYRGPEVSQSPFQQIVQRISSEFKRDVQLKQVGKELSIQFLQPSAKDARARIGAAIRRVHEINSWTMEGVGI